VNVFQALDFADVMIRDWPGDTGVEPSTPPGADYWDHCDIVVRPEDDHILLPTVPAMANQVLTERPNFLYVRVENLGPHAARHVIIEARLTPNLGNPFVYPADWTSIDDHHIRPKSLHNVFPHVPAGGSVIARFEITEDQSDALASWLRTQNAQPTLLALVMAENDYAFAKRLS
jgi:hypothetical protein